jgi:hypothetical protein
MSGNGASMGPEDYIKDRLDAQIKWYSEKSKCNQRWFKRLRVIEVLFATSIPLLVSEMRAEHAWLRIVWKWGYGASAIKLGGARSIGAGRLSGLDASTGFLVGTSTVVDYRFEECCP